MTDTYYSPNGSESFVTERVTTQEDIREPLISSEVIVGDDGVETTLTVVALNQFLLS